MHTHGLTPDNRIRGVKPMFPEEIWFCYQKQLQIPRFFLNDIILLVFLVYLSLNYATGKDNSCTEALGKAFFSLSFASVCATGLTFPPFPAQYRIFMAKTLLLQQHPFYLLIYFEKLYLFCVVLVHSAKAHTLPEELLFKTILTRWGDCGLGC